TAVLLTAGACKRKAEPLSETRFQLNTCVTITLYDKPDKEILEGAFSLVKEYEGIFSKTIETSEVYRINHRKPGEDTFTLSDDTAALLREALEYAEKTDGAYDITIEPVSTLWNFSENPGEVPPDTEIREAVSRVDYRNISLSGNTLTFRTDDVTIDLGSIAKGYIADRVKDYLVNAGVKSAIINLGGNVLCVGDKEGNPFRIGLQKPFSDHSDTFGSLEIRDMSVVTSGVYERNFIKDGRNYHHILDPKTGYPCESGLVAVTIVSSRSVDGDALSTSCFLLGPERGIALLDSMDGVYGYFVTEDYDVLFSDGAEALVKDMEGAS
ncbi:MAG: FAD:protein FMN transferase, partial [Clostridium sp.]|nr:FAD:protein FMN transferase [Clostridium sp.]